MNIFEIEFKGKGSQKQKSWAEDIFTKQMLIASRHYKEVTDRLSEDDATERSYKLYEGWKFALENKDLKDRILAISKLTAKEIIENKTLSIDSEIEKVAKAKFRELLKGE